MQVLRFGATEPELWLKLKRDGWLCHCPPQAPMGNVRRSFSGMSSVDDLRELSPRASTVWRSSPAIDNDGVPILA